MARAPNTLAAKPVGQQAGGAAVYLSRRMFNADMARAETRWQGGNRGGFSSPDYDRFAEALTTALQPSERTRVLVEITKIVSEELPTISLFFRAQAWVFASDLSGPQLVAAETNMSWNIHEWDFR